MNTNPTTGVRVIGAREPFDPIRMLLAGRAYLALVVIIVVFSLTAPNYFSVNNFLTMSQHVAIYAILGLGMLFVVLNGGIDLSVGSIVGLSGVVAGALLQGIPLPDGSTLYFPVWVCALAAIASGALVGLINGLLVARFKVAPFVATLGMLYVARGAALLVTGGKTYPNLRGDEAYGNTGFRVFGFDRILGIPTGVVVMVVIAIVLSLTLNRSVFGRWLFASGGNERASELSGIPVRTVKVQVYVISGVLAAIAGLILTSELTSANPNSGNTYELTAIAAVVIGGASLAGGVGTIRGTLIGAFVIGFLSDGLVIAGVSEYWQIVFKGIVIVLAVMLNAVQYKRSRKPAVAAPPKQPQTSGTEASKAGV